LISAINSPTLRAGTAGLTNRMLGDAAAIVTGTKSLIGS